MTSIVKNYYEQKQDYGMNSLRRKKILSLIGKNLKYKRILDVGCASGYLSKDLKQKDNYVVAVDISENNISKIVNYVDQALVLDIENNNWPEDFIENKFDIIIAAEIIEHIFDQQKFLEKIKVILKTNGFCIMTTPNFLLWNNRLRMLFGQYGEKEILYDQSHIHLLSYDGFKKLLAESGFKIMTQNNILYPNKLEKIKNFLPANLFVFQSIFKLKLK